MDRNAGRSPSSTCCRDTWWESSEPDGWLIPDSQETEAADRIKSLMFTFDDLQRPGGAAVQVLLRSVEKDRLPIALKGASDIVGDLAPVGPVDVACRQEQDPLGQAVVDDVEERAVNAQAADTDAQDQDAHVLDAGIGEHPFVVRRAQQKQRGDEHGK